MNHISFLGKNRVMGYGLWVMGMGNERKNQLCPIKNKQKPTKPF